MTRDRLQVKGALATNTKDTCNRPGAPAAGQPLDEGLLCEFQCDWIKCLPRIPFRRQ